MATITSVGTGAWSASGTWDSGVPADGDDVVIAAGHTVTFDVDQSAFSTGVKVTITGTLTHTTATGTYCLFAKTGASIVGAGTWNIGTSGTPIPFASKHTITGAAGWYVDGVSGLTMTVYGAEPTYTYIKLSGDEAAGQTVLSVDTDVTGDIWAAGDIIRINDINKTKETEERVIATGGIASGAITITAGLTAEKSTGAYIVLITRNVKIIAVGTGSRTIYHVGSTSNKLTIGGGMWYGVGNKYMLDSCNYSIVSAGTFSYAAGFFYASSSMTISGGVFSGNNEAINGCTSAVISGGLFTGNTQMAMTSVNLTISGGLFVGNTHGINFCNGANISGCTFYGNDNGIRVSTSISVNNVTFNKCNQGLNDCQACIISNCTFTSCDSGIYDCASITLYESTMSANTKDLNRTSGALYDTTLGSATEHESYTSMKPSFQNCQSEFHDGVDGALKAWCKGGVVTSQSTVKPDGYTQAYLLDPESDTYPVFFTKSFSVEPGKSVSIEVQLRKDASMTYFPRVYLMKDISNPLAGATPVDTFTMTDSTDTWETDTFSITNSTDYDQNYALWFVAQNATGNAYSAYDITTEGGGTSSVKIMPLGRIGL
jgi:hypothetical protein